MNHVTVFTCCKEGAKLPEYKTKGAAGADLCAYLEEGAVELAPFERRIIGTGLSVALPEGFEMQIRPRSGLALKHGLTVLNSPGTIDSDYRGELGILLINLGSQPVRICHGERIAQAVVSPVVQVDFVETQALSTTERGMGGYGSTGMT